MSVCLSVCLSVCNGVAGMSCFALPYYRIYLRQIIIIYVIFLAHDKLTLNCYIQIHHLIFQSHRLSGWFVPKIVKSCLNLSKLRPKCCRSPFSGHGVIFKKNRPIFITSRRRKWPPDNIFGVAWPWTLTSWVMTRSIVSWLRLPRRPCAKLQWYNIALFVFKLVFWSFVQCSEALYSVLKLGKAGRTNWELA